MGRRLRDEQIIVRLSATLKRRIQKAADTQDETMSALVLRAVVAEVERIENANKKEG